MRKLVGPLMVILSVSCFASDYSVKQSDTSPAEFRQLNHEFNLLIANSIEKDVLKLPKKATIQLTLKNHKIIVGRFDGYSKYDSSLWITPHGKRGLFSSEAYDIMEVLDVRLVVIRGI